MLVIHGTVWTFLQHITFAFNVSANHRHVHLYQMRHITLTLYAYQPPFTSGGGADGGGLIIASKAAKQRTAVRVTAVDIFTETRGHFQVFLQQQKASIFHRKLDQHLWSWRPKPASEAKPRCFPNPNQMGVTRASAQRREKDNTNKMQHYETFSWKLFVVMQNILS